MAAQQKPESSAVAKREEESRSVDVHGEAASRKFLEAFSAGKLDRLEPAKQAAFLMALGQRIGVRAELGELILYQGKPYLTIDGRLRIANESGLLNGVITRPAKPGERLDYGAEPGEQLWVCDVWKKGAARAFRGWGHVLSTERNPVGKSHPRELAKKRAKYDALRTAFPADEQISERHMQFIEEAEAIAEAERAADPGSRPTRVQTAGAMRDYGADEAIVVDPAALEEGEDGYQDDSTIAEQDAAAEGGELPLGETRRSRTPQSEGR